MFKVVFAFLIVFFLEFANILQASFTGIILGHKMNTAKTGFSVLYGFLVYMATQIFAILVLLFVGLFNKDFMNIFVTNSAINIDAIKVVVWLSIAVYSICLIVIYFVNQHLFKKGFDVD